MLYDLAVNEIIQIKIVVMWMGDVWMCGCEWKGNMWMWVSQGTECVKGPAPHDRSQR